jgi:amidase
MDAITFGRRPFLKLTAGTAASAIAAKLGGQSLAAGGPSEIVMMDAISLQNAIQSRRISCVEVMGAYLDHIEKVNPKVNAIVALQDRAQLMGQAKERDGQLSRGEVMGPLHGFPHAVKDLQPVKGMRTTMGSPIFKDFIAPADSLMVERLRKAGAIFIGKTNTPEFGLGSHTFNAVYGATRNAYDQSRSAGGSSGGAGAGLALRMLPVADGSDYGGSLRNPAGWNNVFGFRTSYGRVPAAGRDVWLPSMSVTGPMARNVSDLALLLSVQAGYDQRVPLSIDGEGKAFQPSLAKDFQGKRVAWIGDFNGAVPYEPGVLEVCKSAMKGFEEIGCIVEEASPDYPIEAVWQAAIKIRAWQQGGNLLAYYNDPAKRAMLKPEAIFEIETGLKLSAFDVTAASVVRTEWYNAILKFFQRYDFFVLPAAQLFPFPVELDWPHEIAGKTMATYHEWMKGVLLITMTGCPALAAPAGFNGGGLPIGIQIVAPNRRELECLQLAHAYEQAMSGPISRLSPLLVR